MNIGFSPVKNYLPMHVYIVYIAGEFVGYRSLYRCIAKC